MTERERERDSLLIADSTVQNFMEMLEGKKTTIEEIEDQAVLLKEEDGEKKNGTSDVESRYKDMAQDLSNI